MIKPIISLLLLCLFSTVHTAKSTTLKLGVISDLTGASNYTRALELLDLAAQRLQSKGITQAISLGDLVESLSGMMVQQFNQVTSILSRRDIQLEVITAGDHDVIADFVQNSPNHTNEIIYRKLLTQYGMPVNNGKLYYYVEIDDLIVINLYSLQSLGTDPRWGNTFWSQIQEDQLDWLKSVLCQWEDRPIVVITHQPLWYQVSNWYDVHNALRKYGNVLHVFAGHFHYTQYNGEYDGIPYTVIGATGGNTKQGNSNAGDVRLYGILTLTCEDSGHSLDIDLYSLDSPDDTQLKIPPAKAMDRVQQQSVINGDLVFGGYITIPNVMFYNSTSRIIGTACNSTTPVTFSVIAANAHNIDQVFNIQLLPSNIFTLSSSNFVPGQWKRVLNSTAAVLAGGKNCDLSSFSVSEVVSYNEPIVTMWTGVPAVISNLIGTTTMTFRFSTSFDFEGLTYYLYNDIFSQVNVCR
jgi:hypothetical protein